MDKTVEIAHAETELRMKIQVEAEAREDLVRFLRRADCVAVAEDAETVVVEVPAAFGDEQARMEVDLYLKAWQAANPDVEAHLVDPPQSRVVDETPAAD
jgi:hypothetical protein